MKTIGTWAALALTALSAASCNRSGVGEECNDSSDCRNGLICSPNGTCVDPNTDAAPGTDATAPGTDADAPGTDATGPGTDAVGPGTDATTMGTDGTITGSDAAGGTVTFCSSSMACGVGETCQVSYCSRMGEGFCIEPGRPTCGGFGGTMCPATGAFTSCLDQGPCIADAPGICVTPEERMMICATQAALWGCP